MDTVAITRRMCTLWVTSIDSFVASSKTTGSCTHTHKQTKREGRDKRNRHNDNSARQMPAKLVIILDIPGTTSKTTLSTHPWENCHTHQPLTFSILFCQIVSAHTESFRAAKYRWRVLSERFVSFDRWLSGVPLRLRVRSTCRAAFCSREHQKQLAPLLRWNTLTRKYTIIIRGIPGSSPPPHRPHPPLSLSLCVCSVCMCVCVCVCLSVCL